MKKRFSEEQSIGVLKEAEAGKKTSDLSRQRGITEQRLNSVSGLIS